jgi:sporulation protein YlmC with PRC-barrel domain
MRLCDLRDKPIRTLDGERLGRVHEVHCDGGRVVALMCGAGSWIERMTSRTKGRRIPWESVRRVDDQCVLVASDPPKRSKS